MREHYRSYWDDLVGWDDISNGDPIEDVINLNIRVHGERGYVVSADIGGDEDGIVYMINASNEILYWVHDEQSPYGQWSCGKEMEDAIAQEPSESCMLSMAYKMDLRPDNLTDVVSTTADAADLPVAVEQTLRYANSNYGIELTNDLQVSYETYDTYRGQAFTIRTVIGDPMEPESVVIYSTSSTYSSSTSVELLYSVSGDGFMDPICVD